MNGKQLLSIIIPLLRSERFFRARIRGTIRHPQWSKVTKTLKRILRRILPFNVRMALRRWWIGGLKYPTSKSLTTQFIRRIIEREYNITILDTHVLLAGCPANSIMLLTTKEGGFFAKVYTPNENSVEQVQEEARLFEYLTQHDIHAPVLLRTRTGQAVLRAKHVYPVILMKQEKLRMIAADTAKEKELRRIAQDMAKMHQVLRNYPRKESFKKSIEDPDLMREDWETYHRIIASPLGASFTKGELAMVKATDESIVEYMRKNYPPELKEFSVIHGDLALEHAQFLPDGSVYFFDFADTAWGPIARELAVFFVRLYTSPVGPATFERWEKLKEWALEGYQSVNSLSEVDIKAIGAMMIKRLSEGTIGYDTDILEYERNPEAHIRKKRKRYKLLEYLLNQA